MTKVDGIDPLHSIYIIFLYFKANYMTKLDGKLSHMLTAFVSFYIRVRDHY